MKKLVFILLAVVFTSCVTTQKKEEFPTSQELIDIWALERETGIKYYPFEGKFVTEKELDSLMAIKVDSVLSEILTDPE